MFLTGDDERELFDWIEEYRKCVERVLSGHSCEERSALLADLRRDYMCTRRAMTFKRVRDGVEFVANVHPAMREVAITRSDFSKFTLMKLDYPCEITWRDAEDNLYICEKI